MPVRQGINLNEQAINGGLRCRAWRNIVSTVSSVSTRSPICRLKLLVRSGTWSGSVLVVLAAVVAVTILQTSTGARAAQSFDRWRDGLWLDARAMGISRDVFDRAFKGVRPDLSLPDLVRPGEKPRPGIGQAEFSKTPQQYMAASYMSRLVQKGRQLLSRHGRTLSKIQARFGVPRQVVLAIWGRETAYGSYKLRHYAIRALATQAFMGRRKELFRKELLFALKMLQDKVARLSDMRSSWAGALGLTQTMPSEFDKFTVDMDGDGRRDIWRSVPDALGAAARQLQHKGWVAGQSWGYEVHLGESADCALEGPSQARSIGEWEALGLRRTHGRRFSPALKKVSAYLMSPAGANGPSFLVTRNFTVLKRYNFSDLYALFVGHLADRIAGGGNFARKWKPVRQLPRARIARIQGLLKASGYPIGKIDGLIGSSTRAQIGKYEKKNNLKVACWPTRALLRHMLGRVQTGPTKAAQRR